MLSLTVDNKKAFSLMPVEHSVAILKHKACRHQHLLFKIHILLHIQVEGCERRALWALTVSCGTAHKTAMAGHFGYRVGN